LFVVETARASFIGHAIIVYNDAMLWCVLKRNEHKDKRQKRQKTKKTKDKDKDKDKDKRQKRQRQRRPEQAQH
jgi:hypothetical protein